MIAIQFSNVSLVLGARRIFENLSWEIQHDQKIGLIGPNGAGKSAFEAALEGDYRVAQAQSELEAVEASLGEAAVYANPHSLERTLHAQQRLLEEYQALGGDSYPQRVRQSLLGLGLPQGDLDKPLRSLSGGQKKLVGLARVLLAHPRVLLLDEPHNHLDLAGKLYLEKLVREYAGAVTIISHDRYLLDACVTTIAELEDGRQLPPAG